VGYNCSRVAATRSEENKYKTQNVVLWLQTMQTISSLSIILRYFKVNCKSDDWIRIIMIIAFLHAIYIRILVHEKEKYF
jgi:hypothetical protein